MTFATIDLSGLTAGITASEDEVEEQVLALQRKVTLQLLEGVVRGTPVDTGRARGGWQVTPDRPAFGHTNREDRGGAATLASGARASKRIKPFGISYVTNNVAYIEALEEGHSSQSRAFVATTVARVRAQFS